MLTTQISLGALTSFFNSSVEVAVVDERYPCDFRCVCFRINEVDLLVLRVGLNFLDCAFPKAASSVACAMHSTLSELALL